MRLAEMLSYADIGRLHQLADTYSCKCNANSKNELIQSLLSSIKRDSIIMNQLMELSKEELHFLMHIVFDARTTFSLEDLRAKAKFSYLEDLERETYRNLISIALKRGWIFRVASRNAGVTFQVPDDMRAQWSAAILKKELDVLHIYSSPPAYRDEGYALIEDVLTFLKYLRNHDTPATAEGVIYKRNQIQLLELMSVHEEPVEKGGWRFGYGRHFRDYPDRFSLIYDFCFYRGYLHEELGGKITLLPQADEAVQLPDELMALEMFKFWIRLYKRPITGLAMLVRFVCYAAERDWVEEETLVKILVSRIRPYYYDDEVSIAKNRILKMMVHLGLLKKGKVNEEAFVYHSTSFAKKVMETIEGSAMKSIVLDQQKP